MQAMASRRGRSTAGRVYHDRCMLIDTRAGRIGSQRCGTVGHVNERDTPAQRAGQARGEMGSLCLAALVSRGKHAIRRLRH